MGSVRFLKPDVAVVDGAWETTGAHTSSGKELPTLKGFYTLVLVKKKGRWLVASSRTMVPVSPPRPEMKPGGQLLPPLRAQAQQLRQGDTM